ncbi:SDR family NAD(P)-dependent oxidoreductase [Marispirochaeta sp.]|uniref:SDR family NAD(P)-dependent oxidoreductase n=1 Tax=Marispirochaeta sp. TaxID=2038653 RepID=UPI0029C9479B|nr:SDR family NAD(P)-dependent oxidoreductase [Marispirochaeta sp.]
MTIGRSSYGSFGSLEDAPLSEARNQYNVNVFGLARITQLVLPYMRSQKYGRIINISSVGGIITTPFGGWYQSSKHAVESLSDALRMDTLGFGIDVVVVEPSNIESGFESVAINKLKDSTSEIYKEKAESFAKGLSKSYEGVSKPEVIAKVIKKAVTARRPKPRYVAGKMSRTILILKALLTDRQFDRVAINTFFK